MPTDKEKLAIAEEIIPVLSNGTRAVYLADIEVVRGSDKETWVAAIKWHGSFKVVAENYILIEAIYTARQKLAAEREASRAPEERRLREKIARIREYVSNGGDWDKTVIRLCNEALEQGA